MIGGDVDAGAVGGGAGGAAGGGVIGGAGGAGGGGPAGGPGGDKIANVAVDDETGSICTTKANGLYRCWDADGARVENTLPPSAGGYTRVQLAGRGLVGLAMDGHLFAVGTPIPDDLPAMASFRATNLWGGQGICGRGTDAKLHYGSYFPDRAVDPSLWRTEDGPFVDVTCAWEGLVAGIGVDGTTPGASLPALPSGETWSRLALSWTLACGLTGNGEVVCGQSRTLMPPTPPVLAAGPYLQIAATDQVVCALRAADHGISCARFDNMPIAAPDGRYTFIDGGFQTLCGIRDDGTVACSRENAADRLLRQDLSVSAFVPLSPAIDFNW